jgi:hypothetical protein
MVYVSQLWQRVFQFTYIPFRLDKWLFRMPQGWSIAFKIAMRYTVDNAGSPPSSATVLAIRICNLAWWLNDL